MKPYQKLNNKNGVQVLLYPFEFMNITQSINGNYSHMLTNNIDDGGKDSGKDIVYAPSDIYIKQIIGSETNIILYWSKNEVLFADGTIGHYSMVAMHKDSISEFYVGQEFAQGIPFYKEGIAPPATGNHVHWEIVKGHTTYRHRPGDYGCLSRYGVDIRPDQMFHVNDTQIISSYPYDYGGDELYWKTFDGGSTPPIDPSNPKKNIYHLMLSRALPGFL